MSQRGTRLPDARQRTAAGASAPGPDSVVFPCGPCRVRSLSICAALAPDELHLLAAIVSTISVEPGRLLFQEGDPARHVYVVTEGALRIYKLLADGRRQVIGFLFPGDYLGFANHGRYAYSAEALSATHLCRFVAKDLETLFERCPNLEKQLLGMASHELAVAQEQMLLLGRKTAREKIASFLLMLSTRAGRHRRPENPVMLPMSRVDIGDHLGLTTETVSRTFTHLQNEGVILRHADGGVEILDREALSRIAEAY